MLVAIKHGLLNILFTKLRYRNKTLEEKKNLKYYVHAGKTKNE